jgi:hypothetical protein
MQEESPQPPPLLRRCLFILQRIFRGTSYAWRACRLTSSQVPRFFDFILKLTIFVSLLTFIQRQEPLLEATMNHSTKVLSVTNGSLSPISLWMYVISFDINWTQDQQGYISISKDIPIGIVATRGFILREIMLWPWPWPARTKSVDLTTVGAMLKFIKLGPNTRQDDSTVYCVAVEGQNVLSNQRTRNAILTTNVMFAASPFGPMGNGGTSGGFQVVKKYLDLEEMIKNICMALYDRSR